MKKTMKKMSTVLVAVLLVVAVLTPGVSAAGLTNCSSGSCNTLTSLSKYLSTNCAQSNSVLCKLFGINCTNGTCTTSTCANGTCPTSTCTNGTCPTSTCTNGTCTQKTTTTTTTTKPTTPTTPTTTTTPTTPTTPTNTVSSFEQQVVDLVNQARKQNGLNPLTLNTKLSDIARMKSQDMLDKGYFDHNSPTYGTPFQMMTNNGISYRTAGENIAMGYTTPQAVMNAWMNSSGHRANILNSSFTQIGVGYVANGNYWTQEFIG